MFMARCRMRLIQVDGWFSSLSAHRRLSDLR
ncbi:hypothetical protein H206_05232 [Candidatus Electrothrix aarhusensis]|uniref:Uncharacterized protein n=1 Tax=Candidatus Electrothrix aarhusensis TaxID=1859131 RepID=A0A444J546_9BACT|nr:hypothetical protein H206_05232 [Candidatus Electrothrix aarhusensis]